MCMTLLFRLLGLVAERKRLIKLETDNKKMGDDLNSLNEKMDAILRLLQEK